MTNNPIKTALTAAAIALATTTANATWSILIADTRTGEIVLGSATCLTSIDLAIETPVLLTGIGAITAQSAVDSTGFNRMFIRDRILEGQPLNQILQELAINDPGHNNRQYGMITAAGDTLTYSGTDNANWAGGITGRIEQGRPGPKDDIVYAVQGNILTGAPVVQAAVDALIAADTDLPGKLMAAMLAARTTGGDGRCSCSNGNPTGCGSPPPGDFKSAHVGYMIAARSDDSDAIRGFYDLGAVTSGLATLDLNNDNIPDFAVSTRDGTIELFINATAPGDQVSHLNKLDSIQTNLPNPPNLSKLTAADLDNNGLKDLITLTGSTTNPTNIAIFLQTSPGTFAKPILHATATTITAIEPYNAPDIQGQQLLVFNASPSPSSVMQFKNNQLAPLDEFLPSTTVPAAHTTDLNNDSIPDLLYLSQTSNEIRFAIGNTSGTFPDTPTQTLITSAQPLRLTTADINNDNLIDILVATGSSRVIDTFINTGTPENPTFAPKISSPINGNIIDFNIADMNNDAVQDIVAFTTHSRNIQILAGNNAGSFSQIFQSPLQGGPTTTLLADLNNDGDLDIIADATRRLLLLDNQPVGTIPGPNGFARGRKFMSINIAYQNTAADDPVDQMLTEFQAFRDSLTGKVDAVQTTAISPQRILIDDPDPTKHLRIELRDWQSNLLTTPATFTLDFNPNNLTPGLPTLVSPGIYNIPISALSSNKAAPGNHTLKIQATTTTKAGPHTVTLMPKIVISTTNSLADYNADAHHDFLDISIFLTAFASHNPIADLNNDTIFDITDITLFLNAFKSAP